RATQNSKPPWTAGKRLPKRQASSRTSPIEIRTAPHKPAALLCNGRTIENRGDRVDPPRGDRGTTVAANRAVREAGYRSDDATFRLSHALLSAFAAFPVTLRLQWNPTTRWITPVVLPVVLILVLDHEHRPALDCLQI